MAPVAREVEHRWLLDDALGALPALLEEDVVWALSTAEGQGCMWTD